MSRTTLLAVFAVAVVVVACTSDDEAAAPTQTATAKPSPVPPTPTATPTLEATSTPEPTATPTLPQLPDRLPSGIEPLPPDTRTGIAELDRVIEALVAGDEATLISLIAWQPLVCANASGEAPWPPRCPPGVAEGTVVGALRQGYNPPATKHAFEQGAVFVSPSSLGVDLALCRIAERGREDASVVYSIELRAAVLEPQYDTYVVDSLSVEVVDGRITFRSARLEPGYSRIEAVCTWPPS